VPTADTLQKTVNRTSRMTSEYGNRINHAFFQAISVAEQHGSTSTQPKSYASDLKAMVSQLQLQEEGRINKMWIIFVKKKTERAM